MGVAIIFIMASHTLGGYAAYGIIGVEWFLVLSAIGLYYSLQKNSDVLSFYKRRLIRILPAYLIVAVPYFLIAYPFVFKDFMIRLTGLNLPYWGEKAFWFVTLIIICYLIAPFYFRIVNRYKHSYVIPFVLALITFILAYHLPKTEILVTRIPVFLLGMNLAKGVYEDKVITDGKKVKACYALSVLAVLMLLTIYIDGFGIELVRLLYFFCAIPTLFFVLLVAKKTGFLSGVLAFIGTISYEIYLLHQKIVLAGCRMLPIPEALSIILSYIVAILLAYALHWVISKVIKPSAK